MAEPSLARSLFHMRPQRLINFVLLLGAAGLCAFPLAENTFYTQLLTKIMAFAIFAMSLDLLVGYTGLVSFGHAAFFGIAGYVLALLINKADIYSFFITLPAAMAVGAVFAAITGALALHTAASSSSW